MPPPTTTNQPAATTPLRDPPSSATASAATSSLAVAAQTTSTSTAHTPSSLASHISPITEDTSLSSYTADSESSLPPSTSTTPLLKKLRRMRDSYHWYCSHRSRMNQQPIRCKSTISIKKDTESGDDDDGKGHGLTFADWRRKKWNKSIIQKQKALGLESRGSM
ncbi:uncharacterized protein RCC_08017 [Ramularia collo-cygni]|uniref:Uncharacterized protein n=1 Tax=Ramularia collo-cygni TaxID=112498 RepID=A0A2D3V2V1_9PEZI|nr:uncharacterized protein RCC_08017 [Ramularia collo-cygni]CZT22148.1 uncharacterized protein RCC_08017 [Ramularia collo-cygni]